MIRTSFLLLSFFNSLSIYEVSEKDQENQKILKTKQLAGEIEFDKFYQATLFMSLIFHVSIFLWMLLLSFLPKQQASTGSTAELDKGYSILAGISMVCYVTGLFALYLKRPRYQGLFMVFLVGLIIANVVLALAFKKEENVEYLSVAIFLLLLNFILVIKAIQVYKKMKALQQFAYSQTLNKAHDIPV